MPPKWWHGQLFPLLKIRVCLALGFLCFQLLLKAQQNLVPNPSFEIISACPGAEYGVNLALGWFSASTKGTPDIYNRCATNVDFGVPHNSPASFQMAFEGEGYAGLHTYFSGIQFYREYIAVALTNELVPAEQYFYRFRYSPRISRNASDIPCYTNGLGLAFSQDQVIGDLIVGQELALNPAYQPSFALIQDTSEWLTAAGYLFGSGERYLIIGNFSDNAHTNVGASCSQSYPNSAYMFVDLVEVYAFDPLPDTLLLCRNDSLRLICHFLDADCDWSNGQSGAEIMVQTPGYYSVQANLNGCQLKDTVFVMYPDQLFPPSGFSEELCTGDSFRLAPPFSESLIWENGDTNLVRYVSKPGSYLADVTTSCGNFTWKTEVIEKKCACEFFIPSAFSPNGDGLNDAFSPICNCDYEIVWQSLEIFDRWGKLVWNTTSISEALPPWDGNGFGGGYLTGTFVYRLNFNFEANGAIQSGQRSGNLTLIR